MLTKFLRKLFGVTPEEVSTSNAIHKSKSARELANQKIDAMMATLDGEDTWFLCQSKKENKPHGQLP